MTRNYDAFTLAEVLITLVIVGVIASMTIPTLMNNTNKQEYASRLKKAYSTLSQATNRIITEQGNPKASIGGWATSHQAVYDMYIKYLSKAKECGVTKNKGCFSGTYKRMDNTLANYETANRYAFVLADGTEVLVREEHSSDCSHIGSGSMDTCQYLCVDINGAKGPNAIGKDTFMFVLKNNGLFPAGCDYDGDCSLSSYGWGCTCKVIREGAMNY